MPERFIFQPDGGMPSCRCHQLHVAVVASFSRRESYSMRVLPRSLLATIFAAWVPRVRKVGAGASQQGRRNARRLTRGNLANLRKYYLRIAAISKRYVKSARIEKRWRINRKDPSPCSDNKLNSNLILGERKLSSFSIILFH